MVGEPWWLLIILLAVTSVIVRSDILAFLTVLLALGSTVGALSYRYCLHGVTYRRRFTDNRIFSGEETDLTIEVRNAKPLPLAWLLVREHLPEGLSLVVEDRGEGTEIETSPLALRDVLVLRWYESVERSYRLRGHRRGVYTFDRAELAAGNLFGLEQRQARVVQVDRLIVYPKIVPVGDLLLPFERPAGPAAAQRRIVEDPLRMACVREYVPGDSVRYIHWKVTAHRDQLQTKVFDPQASEALALFVDVQTDHDPYVVVPEYLELVITAAASLALHGLDERRSVGLLANGGVPENQGWTYVPPSRHPRQGPQILEALAVLGSFRTLALSQLLYRARHSLPYGCTVAAITARTTEPVLLALLALQDAGHPVLLLTVGDRRPRLPDRFTTYHLGGRDAWHQLETLAVA
jgi:uncharacterized protein (DUF58 family)